LRAKVEDGFARRLPDKDAAWAQTTFFAFDPVGVVHRRPAASELHGDTAAHRASAIAPVRERRQILIGEEVADAIFDWQGGAYVTAWRRVGIKTGVDSDDIGPQFRLIRWAVGLNQFSSIRLFAKVQATDRSSNGATRYGPWLTVGIIFRIAVMLVVLSDHGWDDRLIPANAGR
jgi:hypothetical protein